MVATDATVSPAEPRGACCVHENKQCDGMAELVTYKIGQTSRVPPYSEEKQAWWTIPWISKGVTIIFTVLMTLVRVLEWKLHLAESKVAELTGLVEDQTQKLMGILETVHTLKDKSKENARRVEIQRLELKEQQTILRELYTVLQMKNDTTLTPYLRILQNMAAGDNSKQFWIFRRHQRNLLAITKPYIHQVIEASVEAGVVSELVVGDCATKCPNPEQQCADVFYKALQVSVSDSPHVFEKFLRVIQQKFKDSKPCQNLCSTILTELNAN